MFQWLLNIFNFSKYVNQERVRVHTLCLNNISEMEHTIVDLEQKKAECEKQLVINENRVVEYTERLHRIYDMNKHMILEDAINKTKYAIKCNIEAIAALEDAIKVNKKSIETTKNAMNEL